MRGCSLDWKQLTIASVLAGIIYNSWPLGLILNSAVVHHGLASELAGQGQPYNWIFIYGDVATGALSILIAVILWASRENRPDRLGAASLGGLIIFGLMAALAALTPVRCISALQKCPVFTSNPITLAHAVTSVLAAFGLFLAITCLWLKQRQNKILTAQAIIYFLLGWWTFITLFTPGKDVFVQNALITVCSICVALYPWNFIKTSSGL